MLNFIDTTNSYDASTSANLDKACLLRNKDNKFNVIFWSKNIPDYMV
ncbi:hypothetical protein OAL80_03670 [Pelagibacteraceae bacterium]|jgi:hypothetical protein|nr:hypothetical protein [Pelagibacteraceae bacterium]